MKYPKRSQYEYAKKSYKIRNWQEYEEGLRRRGDLTIWLSKEALVCWKAWRSAGLQQARNRNRGNCQNGLSSGSTADRGILGSVFQLLGLSLPVPDHTTVSRRGKLLGKVVFAAPKGTGPVHLLIDSPDLNIHVGHLRNPPKQRAWRKLHLAVDRKTGEILAADLTSSRVRDAARVPILLKHTVYRYKTIIGREMKSRTLAGQRVETRLVCKILNIMTSLGMPESCRGN